MWEWSIAMNGAPVRSGTVTESERRRKRKKIHRTGSVDNKDKQLSHSMPYAAGLGYTQTNKPWVKLELTLRKSEKLQRIV
jgi:hypothetical protein